MTRWYMEHFWLVRRLRANTETFMQRHRVEIGPPLSELEKRWLWGDR
jgi:hypothetical protein